MRHEVPQTNFLEVGTLGQMVWVAAFMEALKPGLTSDEETGWTNFAVRQADIAVERLGSALNAR